MESTQHQDFPRTTDDARRHLESLLDEMAELSDKDVSPELFYSQLLERVTFSTSALGAAIWSFGPNNHLLISHRTQLLGVYPREFAAKYLADDQAQLRRILSQGKALQAVGSSACPETYSMLSVPLLVAGKRWGVLVLYVADHVTTGTKDAFLRITQAFAEVAQHFQQQSLLRDFQRHQSDWKRQLDFAGLVHRDLNYRETSYRIANEARNCLDVDRVAVLSWSGRRAKVTAISGVSRANDRSNVTQKLQRLATSVVKERQPLLFSGATEDLSPQVETRLLQYLEESPSRIIAVIPIFEPEEQAEDNEPVTRKQQILGAMILESVQEIDVHHLHQRSDIIVRHASMALANAKKLRRIPFAPLLIPIGQLLASIGWYRLGTTIKVLAVLAVLITAALWIPADFSIEAHGKLVPASERNVFAPANGYVEKLFVNHGQNVGVDEILIQLRSNEFLLKRAEIDGQILTAQAELEAIRVKRNQARRDPRRNADPRESLEDLSADEMRLSTQIASLTRQRDLLQQREDELTIRSPIDGQVLDWELEEQLESRPVSRGDLLVKVADVNGPWVLELDLPDRRTYHVVQAQEQSEEPLPIRFQLVNEPGIQYRAALEQSASIVDLSEDSNEAVVALTGTFDKEEIPHLRHGLNVVARVECGQRSIAYVWTYQLLETVRRRLFW